MIRVFALALLLAGCATPREPVVRTIEVRVPVPVQCLRADDVPTPPAGLGAPPSDIRAALSLALARLLEWRAYGIAADGMLRACASDYR